MGFDLSEALERMGGDEEILKEIAALFVEDAPGMLERIQTAVEDGDASALERAAHALKGSVANFGAGEAVAAALALEQMGRNGDLADMKTTYQTLEAEIRLVCEALSNV